MLREEGLESSWARHRRNHLALVAGFEAMGLSQWSRSASSAGAQHGRVPQSIDEAAVRGRLPSEFDRKSEPGSVRWPARHGGWASWGTPAAKRTC